MQHNNNDENQNAGSGRDVQPQPKKRSKFGYLVAGILIVGAVAVVAHQCDRAPSTVEEL